jgi:sulfite reductase (NADPH) flavoprotein alpha-component
MRPMPCAQDSRYHIFLESYLESYCGGSGRRSAFRRGDAMTWQPIKHALLLAHRWAALVLAPLFLLILLSGAVLAFKPIVDDLGAGAEPAAAAPVDAAALAALLDRVDPQGVARLVAVGEDGRTVSLQGSGPPAAFDLATGAAVAAPQAGFDLFDFAKRLHKDLLVGAGILVEIAAYGMVLIVVLGPFLAWPRLRNTLLGWHTALGWVLFPLAAMLPVTAVLMTLHISGPVLPPPAPAAGPLPLARAIERAAAEADLSRLAMARSFRGNSVLLATRGGPSYLVAGSEVTPLAGGPSLVKQLHEGTWAGAWSGALNLAGALALMGLAATGTVSWVRRWRQGRRRTGDAGAELLVAHASQTGTAARPAEATAEALRAGGSKVAAGSLAGLDPAELKDFRHVLLIVSTTGEGEVPKPGRAFLKKLAGADLSGVSSALLALGDSRYARFCAGGETMRAALLADGASEAVPMARADGEPGDTWRKWLAETSGRLGVAAGEAAAPEPDRAVALTLIAREQLNDPKDPDTHEAWSLAFASREPLDFRPGDLILIAPREGEPERPYSIGSTPLEDPRRLLLTVGLESWTDEQGQTRLGAASGMLCRRLRVGDVVHAKLRRHPSFNPPANADRPMIMVSAGCGIAPFMGFIAEHAAARRRGPTWLVFGNRKRAGDFFYRGRLEAWRQEGRLTRLDTAFSREPKDRAYVQDRLAQAGRELLDWLASKDGILYVCGRASTLGQGVQAALRDILVKSGRTTPEEAER